MLTSIINKPLKTKRNVLLALITAGSLLTATSVQSVKAFEFTYTPWEVDHPDNKPLYVINRERDQAETTGDDIDNKPVFKNNQEGAINQNAQSSHFCIAWNCYQTTTTEQTVKSDNSPLVYGEDNTIKQGTTVRSSTTYNTMVEDEMKEKYKDKTPNVRIYITLTYNKPYAPLRDDFVRVSVSPESGKSYENTIDLARYMINGAPIHQTFTFAHGEMPIGDSAQVCVENLSASSGNSCKVVTNSEGHEPESVTLVIPKSR